MNVRHITYIRVDAGLAPKPSEPQQIEPQVEGFLEAHVDDLIVKATKDDATPPAQFMDPEAEELFRRLHGGTEVEFLDSADQLATRLIAQMNRRTAEGLLVALRAEHAGGLIAGLLKLQVIAPQGAVLERLESGQLQLSAVKDLLDKPGDLQKGALVTTALPAGRLYCADRKDNAAKYFPDAFGIRVFAKPSAATKTFFDVAQRLTPDLVAPIAQCWSGLHPGAVREVMDELGHAVPDLTPRLQEDLIEELENAARPVVHLDTTRKVKEIYKAGEITISGPIEQMRQMVRSEQISDKLWETTVYSDDEPKISHTSTAGR
jgi:hypothetical protein